MFMSYYEEDKEDYEIINILLIVFVVVLAAIYISHRSQLNKEEQLKTPLEELVEVNDHKMSVYVEGDGGGGVVKEQLIQQ